MRYGIVAAVLFVLTIAVAGALGGVQAQPVEPAADDATRTDGAGPTIGVSATGEAEAAPDRAVVRVAVETTADDAATATERTAAGVADVRAALEDADVPADAVTTSGFAIYPEYDFSGRERELVGYRAVHSLSVELDDVDRAGEVIDLAVDNGATRVDGVQFGLSAATRAELRETALTAAMDSARADADAVAAAGDLTITGIESVSTADASGPFPAPVFADRGFDGASTSISPGDVTVTARVDVVYGAEAA